MNMLILEPGESGALLPRSDHRWEHLSKVLRKGPGDSVLAGCTDGSIGKATIIQLDKDGLILDFSAEKEAPRLHPVTLVLGFPRPIQANRIFKDLCSLGVGEIMLTGTDLGEKSYIQSDFFRKSEYRRALLEGAEQAASPWLPQVSSHWTLDRCLASLRPAEGNWESRIVFHPDPEAVPFGSLGLSEAGRGKLILAIGSERGWTARELAVLKEAGFRLASLGDRILKTETAACAAVVLSLAKLGIM